MDYIAYETKTGQKPVLVTTTNACLQRSERHHMTEHAIQLNFEKEGKVTFYSEYHKINKEKLLKFSSMGKSYLVTHRTNGFTCYVYSEKASEKELIFSFGYKDKVHAWFCYTLNFIGWKKIMMPYERGFLNGQIDETMDFMSISSLEGAEIFLDLFDLNAAADSNKVYELMCYQVKDLPLPVDRNFYGTAVEQYDIAYNRPLFLIEDTVSQRQITDFRCMEQKVYEIHEEMDLGPFGVMKDSLEDCLNLYQGYHIRYIDGWVNGKFIENTRPYIYAMKKMAMEYINTKKEEFLVHVMEMLDLLVDQNPKINWYNGRGVSSTLFLLRNELRKMGRLEGYLEYLKKAYQFSKILNVTSKNGLAAARFVDTDDIGMQLPTHLLCILLMEDTPLKVQLMRHFKYYLEKFCLGYANGNASGYKPDGTSYHHGGYIRQYEIVANYSLSRVLYILSDTLFMVDEEAKDRFKKVLDTEFKIYNGCYEHFTLSQYGAKSNSAISVVEFAHAANAFHDRELASRYMTLASSYSKEMESRYYKAFQKEGICPITEMSSHNTYPYLCATFHKRKDWTVGVKGHSRYIYPTEVWSDEIATGYRYSAFMLYRSFGFMELSYPPVLDQGTNNGMQIEKGFDYCKWSGTTAPQVPYEQIKSNPVVMEDEWGEWLHSDECFAGGTDLLENGVFALKLHGNKKYGLDSFYARKSYHFYDDMIVCLGTGIRDGHEEVETVTTLFQDYGAGAVNDGKILMDNRKNGYLILDEQVPLFYAKENQSRDMKDLEDTIGLRTFALISHGKAPKDASYAYLMKVNTTMEVMKRLDATKIQILCQDQHAHITRYKNQTHYVMFTKDLELNHSVIAGVTESCILSVEEDIDRVHLSIADPNLRFDQGACEDYDIDRNYNEHSVYARRWCNSASISSRVWVILNGITKNIETVHGNCTIIQQCNHKTILEFLLKDGLTTEINFEICQ